MTDEEAMTKKVIDLTTDGQTDGQTELQKCFALKNRYCEVDE